MRVIRALLSLLLPSLLQHNWNEGLGWAAIAASVGVKITSPKHGEALYGDSVKFMFRVVGGGAAARGYRLCFGVVNKRVSYFQSTQCVADDSEPFTLRGFVPGVWRARAYLIEAEKEEEVHWKGGHDAIIGADDQVRFVVEPERWREDFQIGYLDRFFTDLEQEASLAPAALEEYRAMMERLPRMRALEIARGMIADAEVQATLFNVATTDRVVIVLMFNEGHLPLAHNALASLDRVGLLEHTIVFGVTPAVCAALHHHQQQPQHQQGGNNTTVVAPACVTIPSVSSFCPHCGEVRDVWSAGFPDIAVLKPVCVLTALSLGYDVLWMDTDVVTLHSPLPYFDPHADLSIQAGSPHKTDVVRTSEQAFRSELCTGFYLARASGAFGVEAMKHVILEMATHADDDRFGDQSATNLVLFEGAFRGLPSDAEVQVLDPMLFPGGGVYFETDEVERAGVHPAIVHNNFIIGMQNKIDRFRERGLWYVEEPKDAAPSLPPPPSSSSQAPTASYDGASLEVCLRNLSALLSPENDLIFHRADVSTGRVVATVALGDRPWVDSLVLPRLHDFARRVGADLIAVKGDRCMAHGVPDFRTCAMTEKVSLMGGLLRCYNHVLLADDTALIRRDCPDLFAMVPPHTIGACLEDDRVRPPQETEALIRLSCLKYNVMPTDSLWFNSGLLLLSPSLVSAEDIPRPTSTDPLLHGDQGYLNAIRHKHGWPIHDLGYAFNFVGSFEGSNAPRRPLENSSLAFIVHATTGLQDSSVSGRSTFLSGVDAAWTARGL